jgi:hypothetical protein
MATFTGQSCRALVSQALLVDILYVQRCLSTVAVAVNLCGSMVIHLKTRKSTGSPNFEELLRTSHHRARCGPLNCRVSFCTSSAMF